MSKRDAAVLLEDIRDAMRKVSDYVEGMDLAAFIADEKTVDAVVRNISVIGEAAKQLPEEFRLKYPGHSLGANGRHDKPGCPRLRGS